LGPIGHSLAALAAAVGLPAFAVALAARPRWRPGWRQRLGAVEGSSHGGVWVHAASVGETRAALPLVCALIARGEDVVLTHTRVDALSVGAAGARGLAPERVQLDRLAGRSLAPLDHPWCLSRALERVEPRVIVMIETELWPNAIREATRRGIAVGVASASISPRSFARYRRVAPLVRSTFARLAFVCARDDDDAERFRALGVCSDRISPTGDLKLDTPAGAPDLPSEIAASLGTAPLLVAGSTHEGEEVAVLGAALACREQEIDARFVIAPRRVDRCAAVARMVEGAGLRPRLRSTWSMAPLAANEVGVLDSAGELPSWYAAATVAFVGGTLAPVGGHNLYEPAQQGVFVLHGSATSSVEGAARLIAANEAGEAVESAEELARVAAYWLARPEAARAGGARGASATRAQRGSVARSLAWIDATLEGGVGG